MGIGSASLAAPNGPFEAAPARADRTNGLRLGPQVLRLRREDRVQTVVTQPIRAAGPTPPVAQSGDRAEIGREEVAAVYRIVPIAVCAATVAALGLVSIISPLGYTEPFVGYAYVGVLSLLSAVHIGLRTLRDFDARKNARWRLWGFAFTFVALVEGVAWGWSAFGLVPQENFPAQVLCLLVCGGAAMGAIAAFGQHLLAFYAFFVPCTTPYMLRAFLSPEPLHHRTIGLIFIYFVALAVLGALFNQFFRSQVAMRARAERLAADLRVQIEVAETANRAKSQFLAAASHDLRQPVHAVGLFVGALRTIPMPPEAAKLIDHIEASSQALDGLFAALLDISRLDAGTVAVERTAFPAAPMLERIVREHQEEAAAKGLRLCLVETSAVLWSDPILVERILRNIVGNAVRHSHKGRVLVGCRRRRGAVRIEVLDTGPGIARQYHETIFQEYAQLGNPERDRAKGLGLGLAIVRRLTALLQCDLDLRSQVGRGSCFGVTVPLASAPAVDEAAAPARAPSVALNVVVVDDEAEVRAAMAALLTAWGHTVHLGGSQREILEALAACPTRPDLILCDFRLRDEESGTDVIEALRSEYNEQIPAILVTGDTAPERIREASESGLTLLHKPVSSARLHKAISEATP